jgi:hypothetical protein
MEASVNDTTSPVKRRNFLRAAVAAVGGVLAGRVTATGQSSAPARDDQRYGGSTTAPPRRGTQPAPAFVPVRTLDVENLPWERDGNVKVFRLIAEPVKREVVPGRFFNVWGYNGSVPGPTIEVNEGDRVRIHFENKLPEVTTLHWHGLEVPIAMDGVPAISQPLVEPGGTFTYEFTLHQHGTFFYHSHMPMQEMIGMIGMFIIHPKKPYEPRVDKDFAIILQEFAVLPHNTVPNTLSMEFNWLTFNGKAGPEATPLIIKQGDRVRIRIVNLGMDHHPIHLHGHQFEVTGTEGGRIPESARYAENTVLVGVAQARVIEFVAQFAGDWMLHCHLPHHMMNQMVSMVGPMAHAGHGMGTGKGMQEGMGTIRQGHALSEELGPGLGRGMGMTTSESSVSNIVGPQNGKRVPGYPQDMWMVMDDEVSKPETYGMAKGWTGAMQGMMTTVRILPPDKYEDIMRRIREKRVEPPRSKPEMFAPADGQPGGGGHKH